jgi:hypothetical protein
MIEQAESSVGEDWPPDVPPRPTTPATTEDDGIEAEAVAS